MSRPKLYTPEPASAPGDFYNVQGECVSCGVPHSVAPDLVGWISTATDPHVNCYWIKQPETPGELERAFKIFDGQEVGCHRYAGTDPKIQSRVGYDSCDYPASVGFVQVIRPLRDLYLNLYPEASGQSGDSESLLSGPRAASSLQQPARGIGKLFSEARESHPVEVPFNHEGSLLYRLWRRFRRRN